MTGHTGFKGSWLTLMLTAAGAEVHGFSLSVPTQPALFEQIRLVSHLTSSVFADIRNADAIRTALAEVEPEVVFHLAAQPLVRESYHDPLGTLATNIMGTAHLLEAARHTPTVRAVVVVTTDKCYRNQEWYWPYRESDALGGHDPYSASKAGAELVAACWRQSFDGPLIASVRAGNVIGGGDWAADRLVPDVLAALAADRAIMLRRPAAVRPWQHVLEPLSGYLRLANALWTGNAVFADAWNFGPEDADSLSVAELVSCMCQQWGSGEVVILDDAGPHEAGLLKLDSSKARGLLGWAPRWRLERALAETCSWHRAWLSGADMQMFTLGQIARYFQS
ncbi:CDP-glucose 4,6-dehydratase [Chitinimonas naiadis]